MHGEILKNIYLFKDLSPSELEAIAQMATTEVFQRGDEIFAQGDRAVAMFVIKFGSIQIKQSGKEGEAVPIALLATGSHFGEMGYIDNEARSATAEAAEKTELIRIGYEELRRFLENNPKTAWQFYKSCAHFLCCRLRATTTDLGFARELHLKHF
jgi:CRP/FNR family transcriptional regulator, cyclic AMP receptor protein